MRHMSTATRPTWRTTVRDGAVTTTMVLPSGRECSPALRGHVGGAPGGRWAASTAAGVTIGQGYYTRREAIEAVLTRSGFRQAAEMARNTR